MEFFDLNIPYQASKKYEIMRMKIAIKAMELGYTGIAYNHTISGVMSDHDRCSIPLFSLSSLLPVTPFIASSVNFHREVLGVSCSLPFRQYTRLTVCVENPAQSQALNRGNPVLKSYDLVAVKPLNQTAFDNACENAEVDIIAIDLHNRLPFRWKHSMIKIAIERGVYFEIAYCGFISSPQARRQLISNAKLLVGWTRGRNVVFSSGVGSVNEIRGPCDVSNLSSLLGLSMERAKSAISKNCRNLIVNALRKRQFYKDTVKVEPLTSSIHEKLDNFTWDPLSSGEGDLQLEDMAKLFCDAT